MKAFSFAALVFALVAGLFSAPAEARHGSSIYLEVRGHSDELRLKRMLRRQTNIDPSQFVLESVTFHSTKRRAARYDKWRTRSKTVHTDFRPDERWRVSTPRRGQVYGVTLHLRPAWRAGRDYRRAWRAAPGLRYHISRCPG